MQQLIIGIIVGSALTGTLVGAAQFYDQQGQPAAPSGSIQQFDYFRGRQQQLDVNAMRREADRQRLNNLTNPCR